VKALLIAALALAVAGVAGAEEHDTRDQLTATQPAASALVAKMLSANPTLSSFKARVHVHTHMLSFPWLSPDLDGTSYFKRPRNYEVVFDRVPGYAKGFEKLFNDVGDPGSWQGDSYIALDGTRELGGKPMLVVKMTKKIYSTTIDYTLAYVDPSDYTLARMEFYYRNGGKISMDQKFRSESGYKLIDSQHAEIDIPRVRAVADSTYAAYQTNVPVDPKVFTKR